MNQIDRDNHPLLYSMSQKAKWVGKDSFPAWEQWADEVEKWLQFIRDRGELDRFLPRLRNRARMRDETLSEIAVAYFLETLCGLPINRWEPGGAGGKTGDLLVGHDSGPNIFIEVKSPGWEAKVIREHAKYHAGEVCNSKPVVPGLPPRLKQPKYLNGEGGHLDLVTPVRQAVAKAYPKLPDSMPTLLIIVDDSIEPVLQTLR